MVVAFHSGFPLGCAITPGARVEKRPVEMPLPKSLPDELVLSRRVALDGLAGPEGLVDTSTTWRPDGVRRARIQRGTTLEVRFERPGQDAATFEGTFVGVDADHARILLTQDGETLQYVGLDEVRALSVRGEAPSGYIGRGVLVGGLTTAVVSAATGAVLVASLDDDISQAVAGICSASIGGGATLAAMAIGGAVGNAQAEDARPRYPHELGPDAWRIELAAPPPPPPRAPRELQPDWPDLAPSQDVPAPPASASPTPAPLDVDLLPGAAVPSPPEPAPSPLEAPTSTATRGEEPGQPRRL